MSFEWDKVSQNIHTIFCIPGHDDRDSDWTDGDHGHRASRLCGLHIVLVGVNRPEARLEVVVVVVIPVVVGVHDDVAHLVEGHEHEGKQVVSVESKVSHASRAIASLRSFHSFNIKRKIYDEFFQQFCVFDVHFSWLLKLLRRIQFDR